MLGVASYLVVGTLLPTPLFAGELSIGVRDERYSDTFADCPWHFWQGHAPTVFGKHPSDVANADTWHSLCFSGFAVLYSAKTRTAIYTAHRLTADDVATASTQERVDSFRAEPFLPSEAQASLADYQGFDYDRGHLVPNGDMANKQHQYDSFSLANIVPQNRTQNRELWRNIEERTRQLASTFGEVYVLTGTAYHGSVVSSMNGVLVPTHLYKVVYVPSLDVLGVYYASNDDSLDYEVLDGQAFFERTGVGVGRAKFDNALFLLQPSQDKPTLGLWAWIKAVATAWQKRLSS